MKPVVDLVLGKVQNSASDCGSNFSLLDMNIAGETVSDPTGITHQVFMIALALECNLIFS